MQYLFLCWVPVMLLTVLAVGLKMPALHLSWVGALFTFLLVVPFFNIPFLVVILSALDGVLTTVPLLLVIFAVILLSTFFQATGSLNRIVNCLMGGVHSMLHRSLLNIFGVTNFLKGASVIAEPVIAPMLLDAGASLSIDGVLLITL